jgi:hypothetical protein
LKSVIVPLELHPSLILAESEMGSREITVDLLTDIDRYLNACAETGSVGGIHVLLWLKSAIRGTLNRT